MSHSSEQPNMEQYQIVKELIDRQDVVLEQIDDLNDRIESFIKEINRARQDELERQASAGPEGSIEEIKKAA